MYRLFLFLLLNMAMVHTAAGQTSMVDSMRHSIDQLKPGAAFINAIVQLAEQNINPDTLLPYVIRAEHMAVAAGNPELNRLAERGRLNYLIRKNDHDSALVLLESMLRYYQKEKTRQPLYLSLLFTKSKVYDRAGQFTLALSNMIDVISLAEELRDTLTLVQARTGIGWVQLEMGQYREALQWLYQAKATSGNERFYKNYGALYSNLAMVHSKLGHIDSARYYIDVAIRDARLNNNLVFLANALSMQARIFIDNHQAPLAEQPLHEALMIRKKINDPFYIVYDMSSLAAYYAANNQPEKGIRLGKEGVALAMESRLTSQLMMIYQALADNYKAAGLNESYGETLEKILRLKDSFNNINSSKMLADLQANREAVRQEKLISEQKLNLTLKNYWLAGTILFSMMAATIGLLLFRHYSRKKKLEMENALREEKRNAEAAIRNAEEKERVRIAADLHDNLGAYAASMASNLNYIRIQENDPLSAAAFNELKNNSGSVISQLNDTIWVLRKENLSLTALSDRVKLFISRIGRSYPDIRLEVSEQIGKDHQLSAAQAFHLYRVVQEGVNNALKHSGASAIIVNIESNDRWKISITDNGKGFDPGLRANGGGHGLHTMRERSRESGWDIRWRVHPTGGTVVEMESTTN
ncbi:MAG TPA: ATP-binding protein [Chitinophagaceae bacterium]|nr:ATP-binding protein [Chitinophagaceae bacterium]HPH31514.1 ATP-binding protein [Chitinophagaceae bacterium]